MIQLRPFQAADLMQLDLQPEQAELAAYFQDPRYGEELAREGARWGASTLCIDGRPRACAGLLPKWRGVLTAWAAVAVDVPRRGWVLAADAMEAGIARALADGRNWRVETQVLDGWPPGHVLMRHLKFTPEGLHRCWGPNGLDYWIYARLCESRATPEAL